MIATTPTISRIAQPILTALQEEVKRARKAYQHSWVLLGEAWDMFNEAVDSGAPVEDRRMLEGYANLAEAMKHDAWVEMNNAEALLLSQWN